MEQEKRAEEARIEMEAKKAEQIRIIELNRMEQEQKAE